MSESKDNDERFFLTDDDRALLRGEKNITEGSARNARKRIRTRFKCALEDFELLSYRTANWRHDRLVQGMSTEDDDLYRQIVLSIGLLFRLAAQSEIDEERIFTEGVRSGAGLFVKDVNVDIEIDYAPEYNFDRIRSTVESGEIPAAWEIGMLVRHGDDNVEVKFGEEEKPIIEFIREMGKKREIDEEHVVVY